MPRSAARICRWTLMAAYLLAAIPASADEWFESRVRPVLADHCWDCHSVDNAESDLRLDSRKAMLRGGSRGPALIPGEPKQSLLVHAIRHSERLQMPPKRKLEARQIADIVKWVESGAPWPNHHGENVDRSQPSTEETDSNHLTEDELNFWAFTSPTRPRLPTVNRHDWIQSPIDRFILAGLEANDLQPAAAADKRTLIRRATFDLIGLPPTPAEVDRFLTDSKPGAFARVVDRLLASPRYGERWGRHWLDVARYADSNGLDENLAFANAFRYRDYVIRSFNTDKPFHRFVREQIAGDLLKPSASFDPFDHLIATGFLSLGAKMLAEDDPVKMQMDIVDEQVDTIGRAFMGLTLGCARCHDHKFDPISITDYYSLAGILKSTKTMEHFNVVARWQERELLTKSYLERKARFDRKRTEHQDRVREQVQLADRETMERAKQHLGDYLLAAVRLESIRQYLSDAAPFGGQPESTQPGPHRLEAEAFVRGNVRGDSDSFGVGIGVLVNQGNQPNWVEYEIEAETGWHQLDMRYAASESRPCQLSVNGKYFDQPVAGGVTGGWNPDSQKWSVEAVVKLQPGKNVLRIEQATAVPHIDKLLLVPLAGNVVFDPVPLAADYQVIPSLVVQWHRFLLNASEGPSVLTGIIRQTNDAIALREKAMAVQSTVALLRKRPAVDGEEEAWQHLLADSQGPFAPPSNLEPFYSRELAATLKEARDEFRELEKQIPRAPSAMGVSEADQPQNIRVHLRGSHLTLGEYAPRRFLRVMQVNDELTIPPEQSGRLQLAAWLTDERHPLTARVIVNRLWQWHFGVGIVASPDNFGRLGQRPTHPELLDWLATQLIDSGWSIKSMHRVLMTSSTYQMSSRSSEAAAQIDPQNHWLSHANRRRLEAEEVRDSVLAVSGSLDFSMGGTRLTTANRAYVTSTANVSPKVYQSRQRSVYLPVVRSALYDVMQSFDFPDPSVTTGKRQSTTVAPQALFMMNSELVSQHANQLASALLGDPALTDRERVQSVYSRFYGRIPSSDELHLSLRHVEQCCALLRRFNQPEPVQRAWQSLCRALMSANEFIYVE